MAFVNERSEKLGQSRTIDYERDAILTEGGGSWGNSGPGGSFTLTWKGEKIIFSYSKKTEVYKEDGSSGKIFYHIMTCEYPLELRPFRDDIIKMIKEALDVYGVFYGKAEGAEIEIEVAIHPRVGTLNPNFNFETQKIEDQPVRTIS